MISHPIEAGQPYTAIALNYYLPRFFGELWTKAKTRVCADGGANRVTDYFKGKEFKHPDFVVGDFDSVKPEVRSALTRRGTEFVKRFNQDFSDVEKTLHFVWKSGLKDPVIIFGGWGGRFDHTISAIHAALARPELRIFFLDDSNFSTWIRPEDKGVICPQKWTGKMCGLLPIFIPVKHVTTKGLKWDCDFGLSLDGLVSSSNEIAAGYDRVEIKTTDPVLWTNQTRKYHELPLIKRE